MLTFGQQHDIARDKVLREELLLLSLPHHAGIRRQQALERRRGLLRLVFLPEAKGTIDQVDQNGIKLGPNGLLCQLVTQYMTWFRHEGILLGSPLLDPGFDPIGTPEIDEQLFQWHPTFGGT